MGEVIVITSGKGGVGKTTTVHNFGYALMKKGYRSRASQSGCGYGPGKPDRI